MRKTHEAVLAGVRLLALGMGWGLEGQVPARKGTLASPGDTEHAHMAGRSAGPCSLLSWPWESRRLNKCFQGWSPDAVVMGAWK